MMGRKLNALFVGKPIWPRDKFPEHEVSSRRLSRKKQKRKAWRQRRLLRSSNLLCPETMVTSFHRNDDAKVFNWHGARTIKKKLTPKTSHHCTADGTIRNGTVTPNIDEGIADLRQDTVFCHLSVPTRGGVPFAVNNGQRLNVGASIVC